MTKQNIKIMGMLEKEGLDRVQTEITLKEVFERVIQLEAKFDNAVLDGKKAQRPFWTIFVMVFLFETINMILNLYMILR